MRIRSVVVEAGREPRLESDPDPSAAWLDDGLIRWVNVEGATRGDLERLIQQLGPEGPVLADHITGDRWFEILDREQCYVAFLAAPTAWLEHERWFHVVRSRAFSLGSHSNLYGQGSRAIGHMREGVQQIQHRLSELQQQYVNHQQEQFNSRVRVLTIISAIFLPLTLIAGIYGMNFENMPELDEANAYFIVLTAMVGVAFGMLGFFYWRGWFR